MNNDSDTSADLNMNILDNRGDKIEFGIGDANNNNTNKNEPKKVESSDTDYYLNLLANQSKLNENSDNKTETSSLDEILEESSDDDDDNDNSSSNSNSSNASNSSSVSSSIFFVCLMAFFSLHGHPGQDSRQNATWPEPEFHDGTIPLIARKIKHASRPGLKKVGVVLL